MSPNVWNRAYRGCQFVNWVATKRHGLPEAQSSAAGEHAGQLGWHDPRSWQPFTRRCRLSLLAPAGRRRPGTERYHWIAWDSKENVKSLTSQQSTERYHWIAWDSKCYRISKIDTHISMCIHVLIENRVHRCPETVFFEAAKQHMSRHYQHVPRKLGGNFSYESALSHETGHMQAPTTIHAPLTLCDLGLHVPSYCRLNARMLKQSVWKCSKASEFYESPAL